MTIRVLITDDSPTARMLLRSVFASDPELEVVGEAKDGREAVEMVVALEPDVVTMDVEMPIMDGVAATKEIMRTRPTPIVVISGAVDPSDTVASMRIIGAGALTVVAKPMGPADPNFDLTVHALARTVKDMADVVVVRRRHSARRYEISEFDVDSSEFGIVGIAASTGGPNVLMSILGSVPVFSVPALVVQHMTPGFIEGMAEWLNREAAAHVKIAEHDERLNPGVVYIAPNDMHLEAQRGRVVLSDAPPIGLFRPSATRLFESLAQAYGRAAIGVVLTGMGTDGVAGLSELRRAGGLVVAQDEESAVVWGMPGAAHRAGVVDHLLDPAGIANLLGLYVAASAE